ncbi:MAG: hypothetical protein KAG97_10860, partial [Victivallales bacterium]|nr:hypothetical protein [Victivallales bacterium]
SLLDIADEEGLLLTQNITGIPHPTSYMVESDEFWKNAAMFAVRTFKQTRNHPCIFNYRLAGEFTEMAGDPSGRKTKRIQQLGEALQAVDPDITLESACDLDLRGWLPMISTHYPEGSVLRTIDNYLPNAIIWRPFDKQFFPGMKVPQGVNDNTCNVMGKSPITWGMKPISVHETGWYYFYRPPWGLAATFGDWVYRGPQAQKEAHTMANEWFMGGHRDAEVSLITPWQHYGEKVIPRAIPTVDVFPLSRHTRWYSDTPVSWEVNIHNDSYESKTLKLTVKLAYGEKSVTLLDKNHTMEPAGIERVDIRFICPIVKTITNGTLTLTLSDQNGEVLRRRSFSAGLYPSFVPISGMADVVVFDPKRQSSRALKQAGYKLKRINKISADALKNVKVLIVGEGC